MTEPFVETKASPKTVEEQIKAKAKRVTLGRGADGWYHITQSDLNRLHYLKSDSGKKLQLLELDDVLAVVNADRAEHNKQLQESFAELAHQIWSEFIDYCLRIGAANGSEFQRKEVWEKWHNLARKRYVELTDREKESDRVIARRYLELLKP